MLACLGAFAGIAVVALVGTLVHDDAWRVSWLVAPMGASAVLLFVVPASPMAQPWPIVGGNVLSAAVGLVVAHLVGDQTLAVALAVALAIGLMSVARCLHPPGGAAALTAVLGGPAVESTGNLFPLVPVGLDAVVLVAVGWAFHRLLSGHSYPHVSPAAAAPITGDPLPMRRVGFRGEDVDDVLASMGEAYDIRREDLDRLLREVEARALAREHGDLTCAEIMSRDVISIDRGAPPDRARRLLLESGVRLLPVLDDDGRAVGGIGLRELAGDGDTVGELMAPAFVTTSERPAIELTEPLTDGHRHAAMVIGADGRLVGLVTQADLLAAVARRLGDRAPD